MSVPGHCLNMRCGTEVCLRWLPSVVRSEKGDPTAVTLDTVVVAIPGRACFAGTARPAGGPDRALPLRLCVDRRVFLERPVGAPNVRVLLPHEPQVLDSTRVEEKTRRSSVLALESQRERKAARPEDVLALRFEGGLHRVADSEV